MKIELQYKYSKIDKTHCYCLKAAKDAYESWVWFYLGKNLSEKGKDFRLYPYFFYDNSGKTILISKVNDARKQGENIAKKINNHYALKTKRK